MGNWLHLLCFLTDECTLESKDLLILPGGTTWREDIH